MASRRGFGPYWWIMELEPAQFKTYCDLWGDPRNRIQHMLNTRDAIDRDLARHPDNVFGPIVAAPRDV